MDQLSIIGKNIGHVLNDLINTESNKWDNQQRIYILNKLRKEADRYFWGKSWPPPFQSEAFWSDLEERLHWFDVSTGEHEKKSDTEMEVRKKKMKRRMMKFNLLFMIQMKWTRMRKKHTSTSTITFNQTTQTTSVHAKLIILIFERSYLRFSSPSVNQRIGPADFDLEF